jgi:hypothetical protein
MSLRNLLRDAYLQCFRDEEDPGTSVPAYIAKRAGEYAERVARPVPTTESIEWSILSPTETERLAGYGPAEVKECKNCGRPMLNGVQACSAYDLHTWCSAIAAADKVELLMSDVHDMEPDDPTDPDTICISSSALKIIAERYLK